jgi:tetratricopeptide (TPR) repeat protein
MIMIHEFFKQPHIIGAMEQKPLEKRESPKSQTSRGKKYIFLGILIVMPIIVFAQNGDCDFSQETIDYLNKGFEYDNLSSENSSQQIDYKIKAINSFYSARRNNPRCETILQQLSVWLVECGVLESKEKKFDNAIVSFEYAIEESNDLLSLPIDDEVRQETVLRISRAKADIAELRVIKEGIKEAEKERLIAEALRKEAKRIEKETRTFLTLGFGYGISYAGTGANLSIYMHPNGLVITGAYGDSGWTAGLGYSRGSRKRNAHLKFLYGEINEITSGYMGFGGNIDVFKDIIGINFDLGIGGDLRNETPSFLWSIGLYVKL